MRVINWHKQHKWSGIVAGILLLVFCLSGVILNHRSLVADCEVSRRWLPSRYELKNWNGGLLRGSTPYQHDKLLIYGVNGVWLADSILTSIVDFNAGFPRGADHRQVRGVVNRAGNYYALTPESVYKLVGGKWCNLNIEVDAEERLSDIAIYGDTIIVAGRSNLYVSPDNTDSFTKLTLLPADDADGKISLFRTVWMLHSGELFGTAGKIVVDFIAVVFIVLVITGIIIWLLPKDIRRRARQYISTAQESRVVRSNLSTHIKVGSATILLTLLLAATGWCLRPPMIIPLAINRVAPLPGSTLSCDNPWHDKLRMIRYDNHTNEWLLSTSEGFFALDSLNAIPQRIHTAPPVSVMGLNVWERDSIGIWLCGSFSGMYKWDRQRDAVVDFFSGEPVESFAGSPFGKYAVSGYFKPLGAVVEYYEGTPALAQPEELRNLPMSLWCVALEAHSGRLFIGSIATYIFVFFAGLIVMWCIITGWKAGHP